MTFRIDTLDGIWVILQDEHVHATFKHRQDAMDYAVWMQNRVTPQGQAEILQFKRGM